MRKCIFALVDAPADLARAKSIKKDIFGYGRGEALRRRARGSLLPIVISKSPLRATRRRGRALNSDPLPSGRGGSARFPPSGSARRRDLVLRLGLEITRVVALAQLARRFAAGAIDHASALHRRPFEQRVGPALRVLVVQQALSRWRVLLVNGGAGSKTAPSRIDDLGNSMSSHILSKFAYS